MWDVGSVCHGMNMCKCECKSMMTWQIELQWGPHIYCKSMMTWQIELQWGPHIYRRCGIWDVTSICHGMYTCNL